MLKLSPHDVVGMIDQMFQGVGSPNLTLGAAHADRLAAILEAVDGIQPELIDLDGEDLVALVAARAAIRETLDTWKTRGEVRALSELRPYGLNVLAVLRRSLSKCPTEPLSLSDVSLGFILDAQVRRVFQAEISAVSKALSHGEWKAATVLGGSALEALLLWAIQEHERQSPGAIARATAKLMGAKVFSADPGLDPTGRGWSLHHYIEVALELGIIKQAAAKQGRLAKDYRDLIHPAVAIRMRQDCNAGTAHGAFAALQLAIGDLS